MSMFIQTIVRVLEQGYFEFSALKGAVLEIGPFILGMSWNTKKTPQVKEESKCCENL